MAYITYGVVPLEIVLTRGITREVLMSRDGMDYYCTRFVFDVDCVYNPSAMAYRRTTAGSPVRDPGADAFATDVALRHYLSQPRRLLIYQRGTAGGTVLLRQPEVGRDCDVKGGPFVKVLSVTQNLADRTFIVSIQFETFVHECPASQRPVLLLHRWKRFVHTDEHHLTTVYTEGEATFNLAELVRLGTIPDQYRHWLFPPLPVTMRRVRHEVIPTSDGASVNYRTLDTESMFSWDPAARATRVEATQRVWMVRPSFLSNLQQALPGALVSVGQSAAQGLAFGPFPGVLGSGAGAAAGAISGAIGAAGSIIGTAIASMPTINAMCTARVWGNRDSRRKRLQELAVAICLGRIGPADPSMATTFSIMHDVTGKFVEVSLHHVYAVTPGHVPSNPLLSLGLPLAQAAAGDPNVLMTVVENFPPSLSDDTSLAGKQLLFQGQRTVGTSPPFQGGTRGTWVGRLVAQGLQSACSNPTTPTHRNYVGSELSVDLG